MAKTLSFIVLVALILLVGAVFVVVMRQFLLPLFLAVLLVIMFRPLHEWHLKKFPKHRRAAAGITTLLIIAIVLIPLLFISTLAGMEAVAVAQSADPDNLVAAFQKLGAQLSGNLRDWAQHLGVEVPPDKEIAKAAVGTIKSLIAPAALRTTQFLGSFLFGLIIMLVSMYFFFADGPQMVDAIIKLTPMDPEYVLHLLEQFDKVSRAVVLATLLSALGQGLLAGIGYLVVGIPHLFLLTAITGLMALVPFVGATAIWLPCAVWLYFLAPYATQEGVAYGRPAAAIALAIWGGVVVGMADNFIKPYVLRGQSNIHPLLALLSVIGGVQALGPIGIFVGPMVVAFLHALLTLLRGELKEIDAATKKSPVPMA
jgi:predicted PurR-regulated permease PerM